MSPVRYKLGFYIPEVRIVHSHRREYLKSYLKTCKSALCCIIFKYTSDIFGTHCVCVCVCVFVWSVTKHVCFLCELYFTQKCYKCNIYIC
jgi:hypothetical protein